MKTIAYTMHALRDIRVLPPADIRAVRAAIERVAGGQEADEMMDFGGYKRFRVGFVLVRYHEDEDTILIDEALVTFGGK